MPKQRRLLIRLRKQPNTLSRNTKQVQEFVSASIKEYASQTFVRDLMAGLNFLKQGGAMRAAKRFNLSMNADFLPEAIRAKEIFLWERVIGGHMFAARAQQKGIVPGNPKADVLASKIRRENDELIINAWHKASLITDKTRDSLMKTGIDAPLAPHFALYPNKKNKGRQ